MLAYVAMFHHHLYVVPSSIEVKDVHLQKDVTSVYMLLNNLILLKTQVQGGTLSNKEMINRPW